MKTKGELYQKVPSTQRVPRVGFFIENRTRNTANKIHNSKTQDDHLGTHQALRRVTAKHGTTPLTTEFLAYHFLLLDSRVHHVKTRLRSWSRSSRATSTRNLSFGTTPRCWSFVKTHPNSNAPIAILTGKSALLVAVVEEIWNLRGVQEFDQKNRDVTSIPGYVIQKNSSRGAMHGTSERQKMAWNRPDTKNTDAIQRWFHDGVPKKITVSLCQAWCGKNTT